MAKKKRATIAVAPCKRGIRFCENPSSGDVETVSKKLFQITTGTSVKTQWIFDKN